MLLEKIKIGARLSLIVAGSIVGILVLGGESLIEIKSTLLEDRKIKTEHLVETAGSLAAAYHKREQSGEMSREEAQKAALLGLENLRYDGGREYFWVQSYDNMMVMHPTNPSLNGKKLADIADPNGVRLFSEMVAAVKRNGAGFVAYEWTKPGMKEPAPKISFVSGFEPWGWIIGSGVYIDDVNEAFYAEMMATGGMTLAILILVVAGSVLVSRSIARPLGVISGNMRRLAEDDKSIEIEFVDQKNEIGDLARAMKVFLEKAIEMDRLRVEKEDAEQRVETTRKQSLLAVLRGMVGAGIQSNQSVMKLTQMRKAINESKEQAHSMAAAVEELVASIQQIAETSSDATDDAKVAESAAGDGVSSASQASSSMEQIVSAVDQATNEVNTLAQESERIGEIVSQIEDIAEQTNLLALNATIEAARAGDAGKGFAVVASEVKNLANQTARSTEDIKTRIESLRSKMQGIVVSMRNGTAAVSQGREVITKMGNQLGDISERVNGATVKMAEISGILTQQTAAANDVSRGTGLIASVASENDAEIDAILGGMDRLNTELTEQIGGFADLGLDEAILEITKNDHIMFVKRVVDVVAGRAHVTENQLPDHHLCRLGKWCDGVRNPMILNSPAYAALKQPHKQVHDLGKEVLRKFHAGDVDGALAKVEDLRLASEAVIRLLEELAGQMASAKAA